MPFLYSRRAYSEGDVMGKSSANKVAPVKKRCRSILDAFNYTLTKTRLFLCATYI